MRCFYEMSLQFEKTSGPAPGTKASPRGVGLSWFRSTHLQASLRPAHCPRRGHAPSVCPRLPQAQDPRPSPGVDDLSLAAAVAVVVQNDVAVTAVELSVRGGVHRHFAGTFNSPDLPEQSWA